jgi:hypothetical protein
MSAFGEQTFDVDASCKESRATASRDPASLCHNLRATKVRTFRPLCAVVLERDTCALVACGFGIML